MKNLLPALFLMATISAPAFAEEAAEKELQQNEPEKAIVVDKKDFEAGRDVYLDCLALAQREGKSTADADYECLRLQQLADSIRKKNEK